MGNRRSRTGSPHPGTPQSRHHVVRPAGQLERLSCPLEQVPPAMIRIAFRTEPQAYGRLPTLPSAGRAGDAEH